MALRGAVGSCPRCGSRGWFKHWFKRQDRCPTCGYKAERSEGYMLGAMTMNVIITFFLMIMVVFIGSILSYPDIAVVPMLAIGMTIALGWPLFFYPMSYTLWAAVDLLMRPLDADERAEAERHANPAWQAAQSTAVGA